METDFEACPREYQVFGLPKFRNTTRSCRKARTKTDINDADFLPLLTLVSHYDLLMKQHLEYV